MSNLKATHIFEIRVNAEGDKLCLANPSNDDSGAYRIAGPKAWGGSSLIEDIEIRESDLVTYIKEYAPHLAPIIASDLIEQQQQRIAELEHQLAQYRIDNLKIKADNNELSATIYRLRDALQTHTAQPVCCGNVDIEYSPDGEPLGQQCCGWGDFEWPQDVVELLSATPQQNLDEHDAEVARKAYVRGYVDASQSYELGCEDASTEDELFREALPHANEYAKSIKDGE